MKNMEAYTIERPQSYAYFPNIILQHSIEVAILYLPWEIIPQPCEYMPKCPLTYNTGCMVSHDISAATGVLVVHTIIL